MFQKNVGLSDKIHNSVQLLRKDKLFENFKYKSSLKLTFSISY